MNFIIVILIIIILIIILICSKYSIDYFTSNKISSNNQKEIIKLKNNKIILCLFGVIPRGINKTWDSIKTNIIDVLEKKEFKIDIYVFNINVENNEVDGVILNQNDINIILDKNYINYYEEKLQSEIDTIVKIKFNQNIFTQEDYTKNTIINAYRQLYAEYSVGQFLEKNKNKYDLTITCCSDLYFINKINLKHIDNSLIKDNVYLSNINNSMGLTNGFYFGKIYKLLPILNRYDTLKNKYHNYEQTLLEPVKENNIKYKFTDIIFFKIRANN